MADSFDEMRKLVKDFNKTKRISICVLKIIMK